MAKVHAISDHESDFWYRGKLYKHGDPIELESEEEYNSLIHNEDPYQIIKLKKKQISSESSKSNTATSGTSGFTTGSGASSGTTGTKK